MCRGHRGLSKHMEKAKANVEMTGLPCHSEGKNKVAEGHGHAGMNKVQNQKTQQKTVFHGRIQKTHHSPRPFGFWRKSDNYMLFGE